MQATVLCKKYVLKSHLFKKKQLRSPPTLKMSLKDERAALLDNDSEDEADDFFLHGPKVSTSGIREQLDDVTSIGE